MSIKQNKVVTRYKEKTLRYEDDFPVEQVNQRGCEIFVLRGFQDVAGQTSQKPGRIHSGHCF